MNRSPELSYRGAAKKSNEKRPQTEWLDVLESRKSLVLWVRIDKVKITSITMFLQELRFLLVRLLLEVVKAPEQ